jgi:acyl-CoA synthetase (AMP-forming)/AMP-acid ligase II
MIDIQESTVGARLNQITREHPEREALVHQQRGIRFTYRTFMDQAGRLARGLMALGIQKGDPVALWGSNCPEWVRAHCREQLSEALQPEYIRLVDDFPMTRSGKWWRC